MCILSGLYQKIFSNFGLQYPKLIWFQIQSQFVDRYLISSTTLVLESLHFKSDQQCSDLDVGFWIITTVKRGLCETSRLPQSLYTCRTLVVLTLQNVSLVDVQFPVCFKLLKTYVAPGWGYIFLDDETRKKILSCCHILKYWTWSELKTTTWGVSQFCAFITKIWLRVCSYLHPDEPSGWRWEFCSFIH